MTELLKDCLQKISALPDPLANALREVVVRVSRLHADMQAFVHGRGSSFVDGCEEAFRALKINIRATAPDFRPFDRPELYTRPEDPAFQRKLDEVYTEPLPNRDQCPIGLVYVRNVLKQ